MAIIYNGTQLSSLKYNGKNVDVVWVCDTSTTCCTKVFPSEPYCMPVSIIGFCDICSVYCCGASGSFGVTMLGGKPLCLYAWDISDDRRALSAVLNASITPVNFAVLRFDTSDFIGCTLEAETSYVSAMLCMTSKCCMSGTGASNVYSINTNETTLLDNGNTHSAVISGATTNIVLASPNSCVCAVVYDSDWNNCFSNFIRNVCDIKTCVFPFYIPHGEIPYCSACITVRIKDSANNVILCGMYCPIITCTCVVLN